jgi:hypothetical protein
MGVAEDRELTREVDDVTTFSIRLHGGGVRQEDGVESCVHRTTLTSEVPPARALTRR